MSVEAIAAGTSPERAELKRIRDFNHQVMQGSASAVVPVTGGFAVIRKEFPDSWEHNCLVVGDHLEPGLLMEEADRVLGGAGVRHRSIELELEVLDASWLAEFRDRGYEVHPTLTMVLRRPSERRPSAPVERVSYEELKPVVEAGWRRALTGASEQSIRQLVERRLATHRACQVTHHAVRGPDGLVARCDLYRIPPIAQVENVETEPGWQNRGYATSVVLDAVDLAESSGCTLIFLIADADDWPQQLYRRLGFEQVGGGVTLQRATPVEPAGTPSAAAEYS
ncbi:MAG TPA: GNAT family N-acetyltransferase [Candidatus Dormibacteraeota bacterium]|nr:GNAT family N-acetyltransferase [Candidatus Dormibacteraeota bacterium]